jgi:hypothetical protein
MSMKLAMSILSAVSFIYFLYLGIIPIADGLEYLVALSLIAAVAIPRSGMLESKFMEGEDDEIGSQEPVITISVEEKKL